MTKEYINKDENSIVKGKLLTSRKCKTKETDNNWKTKKKTKNQNPRRLLKTPNTLKTVNKTPTKPAKAKLERKIPVLI